MSNRCSFFTVLFIGTLALISSCKVYKPTYYFKDVTRDTIIRGFDAKNTELVIREGDLLDITISSLSSEEDALYNRAAASALKGHKVDPEGKIYLHKLGNMAVAGLTRKQLKSKLENDLSPYLKDPIVNVNFGNHRVTVFGETTSKVVEMPDEKISLLEVMAIASPVTVNSELNKVMIIRESSGAKEFKHINLEDPSIITSPWYYLQPNDIVVVKPNAEKMEADAKRLSNQMLFTTIISGVTFVLLIIDRILR